MPDPELHLTLAVDPAWIDLYGHMNSAEYVRVFDQQGFVLMDRIGLGAGYTQASGCGVYTVDLRVSYRRELLAGQSIELTLKVLASDEKRVLCLLELYRQEDGALAASMEQLSINVNLTTRKVTPFSDELAADLKKWAQRHRADPPYQPALSLKPR